MKVYVILSLDANGVEKYYKNAYFNVENAMKALETLRKEASERGDNKTIFYYSELTVKDCK